MHSKEKRTAMIHTRESERATLIWEREMCLSSEMGSGRRCRANSFSSGVSQSTASIEAGRMKGVRIPKQKLGIPIK